jgi:hypothetical protein
LPREFHANVSKLSVIEQAAYSLSLMLGSVGLFFVMAFLALATRGSNRPLHDAIITLLLCAFSGWHIVREFKGYGPLPRARWIAFAVAVISLSIKSLGGLPIPTPRVVLAAVAVLSGLLILAGRMIALNAGPPRNAPD